VLVSVDFNTNIYDGALHRDVYEIPERTCAYAFTFIKPSLQRLGVDEAVLNQIMRENPRRMLTIES
jgi:predicted metal-dependent phosphotriesterase family hydrolase